MSKRLAGVLEQVFGSGEESKQSKREERRVVQVKQKPEVDEEDEIKPTSRY